MSNLDASDLDQAVAKGVITAAQRTDILQLAATRATAGIYDGSEDSEPLEIFHGFAEIFVSIGLIILLVGVGGGLNIMANETVGSLGVALVALGLGHYYITRRHMLLPAILLTATLATTFAIWSVLWIETAVDTNGAGVLAAASTLTLVAMALYHRIYKVPFAIFTMGLAGAGVVFGVFGMVFDLGVTDGSTLLGFDDGTDRIRNVMTAAGLTFGVAAVVGALLFDMRDPHRVSRSSKCGFWLHLLAGPALINALASQSGAIDGTTGYALTFLLLLAASLFALIIDRRSFLTAGILYLAALIGWATSGLGDYEFVTEILVLGLIITGLGTWWHKLRAWLFHVLPAGKWRDRLPPLRG